MNFHSTSAQQPAKGRQASSQEVSLAGQTILVVEDDAFLAVDLVERLQSMQAEKVDVARSANTALASARARRYSFALLDANLDGEFSDAVAAEFIARNIPFMFVTGYRQSALPSDLKHIPLLMKPFSEDQLQTALRALLTE